MTERQHGPEAWWGDLEPYKLQRLWDALESAYRSASRDDGYGRTREEALEYRNGLLTAWCIVTGQNIEDTYESLQYLSASRP